MKMNTMNLQKTEVDERSLERVRHWPLNPRYNVDDHGEDLDESLERCGLMDKIHVWVTVDGDWVLRGNRRLASMRRKGWTACGQVLVECADEREALLYCLEDVGNTVPLTVSEKIDAVRCGVKVGLCADELCGPLAMTSERVQLYFDLGTLLPSRGREALHEGKLAVETAEMIVRVEDEKLRLKAVQMVLLDPLTKEPLAPGMARAMLEQEFLRPQKWAKAWAVLEPKLKKKLRVVEGYQFVPWEDREEYVQGPSGQPHGEYELADVYMPKDAEGRTWGQVAKALGAPVFVCAAPMHKEEHVLLVGRKMVREAAAASQRNEEGRMTNEEGEQRRAEVRADGKDDGGESEEMSGAGRDLPVDDEMGERELCRQERLRVWLKVWLGAIFEALVASPTDVMTKEPWLPLGGFLAHLVTRPGARAFEAWTGYNHADGALAWMRCDTRQRSYLRHALMLLLCAESDASDQPEAMIRAVAEALGIDGKALEARVEAVVGK